MTKNMNILKGHKLKSFDTFEEMEDFVNSSSVRVHSLQRIEERDVYTDLGNPFHGQTCNIWATWVLVYEEMEVRR